jgi:Ku protein
VVEDEELDAIEIASTHTIEIDRFVPRDAIDQRFLDTPYYVTPNEPAGHEAFAVIREAMRHKAMVALGRLVLSKRERVIALEPYDKGLLGTTLRYPYEVRDAKNYFGDLPELAIAPDMLTLAEHILDSKAGAFEPASFRDRYEEALLAHLKARQAGVVHEPRPVLAAPHRFSLVTMCFATCVSISPTSLSVVSFADDICREFITPSPIENATSWTRHRCVSWSPLLCSPQATLPRKA